MFIKWWFYNPSLYNFLINCCSITIKPLNYLANRTKINSFNSCLRRKKSVSYDTKLKPNETFLVSLETKNKPNETKLVSFDTDLKPNETFLVSYDTENKPNETNLVSYDTNLKPNETFLVSYDTKINLTFCF